MPSELKINDKDMTPKERFSRYIRRDKAFFAGGKSKKTEEAPIKYDFRDPVLNREFFSNMTKRN